MLPNTVLPPGTAASVYIKLPNKDFEFLGAIANEKQSAIFRVKGLASKDGVGGLDDMVDDGGQTMGVAGAGGEVRLGISVEPVGVVEQLMLGLQEKHPPGGESQALVKRADPKLLAKRIIQNAYNYLSSFAEKKGSEEWVPLRAFTEWWNKFESRIDREEGFLERTDF